MFITSSKRALRSLARRTLPAAIYYRILRAISASERNTIRWRLSRLRRRMFANPPRTNGVERFLDYTVRINDGPNFYILYKDIFIHRIYHFESQRRDPFILDCGSNIGMSILYFRHVYPQARIIGFEPDPVIFPYLQENIAYNRLKDVELVQAALSAHEGTLTFYSDGKYGSCLGDYAPSNIREEWMKCEVPCVRLRDYLTEPLDFMKLNIEGAEWKVLSDSEDRLSQVREMVIEYHHSPELPRTLHKILELLHRQGFEYLVNDFDWETNNGVQTPFRLTPESTYFLLIYAKRLD